MEGEMGTGARIAIALIVLGVLISVVFTILGFTRNTTNQGISTVQNSLESMQLAVFDDYDQQIQSGTQVLSALKLFEGRPVGLVVRTKAQIGKSADTGHNYGAQFDGTDENFVSDALTKTGDNSWYVKNLDSDANGTMTYNMNYLPAKQSGTDAFIRPTAKFLAELMKDTTGTIVGICFTQQ
ncbi:hypothetical protein [Vallitalea guaymasensis]|uniref:Uncharacterized protein n=1 Tax=Vallitalea guaymasensis TaxID=1185412 RepID=A0A8J8MA17_9FIRM|nr:hypothetical protein [Vallitalea guaymasensis]QUH29114.1 hypothetical protein HYG85_09335 [Vallitalea guaymasensis]